MNKTIMFPALSVGSGLSVIKKDIKHFVNGGSFRFMSKDSIFHYPYMLASAAHCFKDKTFKKDLNFSDDGLLFGDSGGFQMWSGKAPKEFSLEVAMEWLNENADIFPILDIPTSKDKSGMTSVYIEECAQQSIKNAKYFYDNRKPGNSILNVLHGRNVQELNVWYNIIKEVEFEGWAYGGISFQQIATAFFFLLEKGELQKAKYFHVFGITRPRYIIFMTYLQKLLNEMGIKTIITFDSSYPFRTSAFGSYFMLPGMEGIRNVRFTNTIDYTHLPEDAVLPCDCPYCKDVPIRDFTQFTTDKFYAISSFHNLYILVKFKDYIEKVINMSCDYLLKESFNSKDFQILKLLKHFMEDRKPNKALAVEKVLEPIFRYELEEENSTLNELF